MTELDIESPTFKPLGYDEEYFYFERLTGIGGIVRLSANEIMTEYGCRRIVDNLHHWRDNFVNVSTPYEETSSKVDWEEAGRSLVKLCLRVGFYHPQVAASKTEDISKIHAILAEVANRPREDKRRKMACLRNFDVDVGRVLAQEASERVFVDSLISGGPSVNDYFSQVRHSVADVVGGFEDD